jgi:hypothetical protein
MVAKLRELRADEVEFVTLCHPEDISIEGNCMASGDDEVDATQEQWVRDQLDGGNEWAWCMVEVVARWKGWEGRDTLGGCSYLSREDFCRDENGYYWPDMKAAALDALNAELAEADADLEELRELVA